MKTTFFRNGMMVILAGFLGILSASVSRGEGQDLATGFCKILKRTPMVRKRIQSQIEAQTSKMFNHGLSCEQGVRSTFNEKLNQLVDNEFVPFCVKEYPKFSGAALETLKSGKVGKDELEKKMEEAAAEAFSDYFGLGKSGSLFSSVKPEGIK